MKQSLILVIDADVNTSAAVLTAAETGGLAVRFVRMEHDFSEITRLGLDDVAVIVLDYDPDLHGPAIVEILERWLPNRPLIFVSNADDLRHPMVVAGGMARHLIKPVTTQRLVQALDTLVHAPGCRCPSCDRWGHPYLPPDRSKHRPAEVAA